MERDFSHQQPKEYSHSISLVHHLLQMGFKWGTIFKNKKWWVVNRELMLILLKRKKTIIALQLLKLSLCLTF